MILSFVKSQKAINDYETSHLTRSLAVRKEILINPYVQGFTQTPRTEIRLAKPF